MVNIPLFTRFLYIQTVVTLPQTNIAPENGWLEYYFPIGEAYFHGQALSFREVIAGFLNHQRRINLMASVRQESRAKREAESPQRLGRRGAETTGNRLGCWFMLFFGKLSMGLKLRGYGSFQK